MIFKKPKFWDYRKPNFISLVLLPFTIILIINNILTNIFLKKNNPKIKSICVGNIYVGGTGKTPFTIKIYQILKFKCWCNVIFNRNLVMDDCGYTDWLFNYNLY